MPQCKDWGNNRRGKNTSPERPKGETVPSWVERKMKAWVTTEEKKKKKIITSLGRKNISVGVLEAVDRSV